MTTTKRMLLSGLAAAMLAAPLTIAPPAAADNWRRRHRDRDERRDHDRRDDRWDDRRHNGYWDRGRWYYGPPRHFSDAYRYDYRGWRRGDRLPGYYRDHYRQVDWRRRRLRAPPRGCHYLYNEDRDEYILVGIATGVILGVILAH